MKRTPGSWEIGRFDRWSIQIKVRDAKGGLGEALIPAAGREMAEERFRLLSRPGGCPELLKQCRIKGEMTEVVGVFRERTLVERIHVREGATP